MNIYSKNVLQRLRKRQCEHEGNENVVKFISKLSTLLKFAKSANSELVEELL